MGRQLLKRGRRSDARSGRLERNPAGFQAIWHVVDLSVLMAAIL